MEEQILIDSIYQSMQDSARQVRRSLGRTSYATTREQALSQVAMLEQAKQEAQQTGKCQTRKLGTTMGRSQKNVVSSC